MVKLNFLLVFLVFLPSKFNFFLKKNIFMSASMSLPQPPPSSKIILKINAALKLKLTCLSSIKISTEYFTGSIKKITAAAIMTKIMSNIMYNIVIFHTPDTLIQLNDIIII